MATFKAKKRCYRRQESNSESDQSDADQAETSKLSVADILEMQKLKKRRAGLSAAELALGREIPPEMEFISDPLKLRTGGIIDLKRIKTSDLKNVDIEEGIKQTFSRESHLRDEDEEMRRYVEEELAKRKGREEEVDDDSKNRQLDDVLYELPEHLKRYQSKRTEDMLSNQMLCGIPEVDLGIDAKIRNIEETETAKLKLLKEAIDKKKNIEETLTARRNLVKDLSKSYVQHSYFKMDDFTNMPPQKVEKKSAPVAVVGEDAPKWQHDNKSEKDKESAPQPSDKDYFDSFKRKFMSNNRR